MPTLGFTTLPNICICWRNTSHLHLLFGIDLKEPMPGLKKRSVAIGNHSTSVALEPEFWSVLDELAVAQKMSLRALLIHIDATRGESLLASACRLQALRFEMAKAKLPRRHAGSEAR